MLPVHISKIRKKMLKDSFLNRALDLLQIPSYVRGDQSTYNVE